MRIKDFFYFSKKQQAGIIILLSLIFLTWVGGILLPYILPKKEIAVDEQFMAEAKAFRSTLKDKEPAWKNYDKKAYNYYESAHYTLFDFDPNVIDSAGFVKLGLKPYIARNILKYRSKGGKFRTPESFAKVYGLTPQKFEELKPHIKISESRFTQKSSTSYEGSTGTKNEFSTKKNIVLELNSADTAQLKEIRGIGSFYAKRIVGYRALLGGYASVEQLQEVYGMRPESYEQIRSSFTVNPQLIHKIDINAISLERLKAHPYVRSFEKAKAVYDFRKKKGKFNSINDLKELNAFSEEDLKKLTPYLKFE